MGISVLGLTSAWLDVCDPVCYYCFKLAGSCLRAIIDSRNNIFHCMICFGGGFCGCRLPAWIGNDMCTWASYDWTFDLFSFIPTIWLSSILQWPFLNLWTMCLILLITCTFLNTFYLVWVHLCHELAFH